MHNSYHNLPASPRDLASLPSRTRSERAAWRASIRQALSNEPSAPTQRLDTANSDTADVGTVKPDTVKPDTVNPDVDTRKPVAVDGLPAAEVVSAAAARESVLTAC